MTKSNLKLSLASFSLLVGFSQSLLAHHSNAPHFDNEVELTHEGVVTQWKLINPHAYIYFDVTEADGSTTQWHCETEAASALRRRGYTPDTFLVGDKVTVIGNPARREANSCFTRDFILADGTVVSRNTILTDTTEQVVTSTAPKAASTERPAYLSNGQPNISGFWWDGDEPAGNSAPLVPPAGGGMTGMGMGGMGSPDRLARLADIAMTPAGEAQLAKYEFIYDDPSLHCKIANIMDAIGRDESVNEIRQDDNTITIQYGYMDYLRTIYLDVDEHPNDLELSSGGHSIGRWEDETLIVESFGFLPSVLHPRTGIPTSDQLKIVERFNYDHETKEINREYIASDPVYLFEEYTGQDTLRISKVPYEPYGCQPLVGINNLRPGSAEYETELERQSGRQD